MVSDAHWMRLEPLIEACRPKGKTPPQDLRRTISAILWRHQNGAKWRAIPADLGPWSRAAQMFIRWAHLNPVYFEKRSFSSSGSSWSLTQRRSAMTKGSRFRRTSKSAARRVRSSALVWQ